MDQQKNQLKEYRPILWQLFPSFLAITIFVLVVTTWGVSRIYKANSLDAMKESLKIQISYIKETIKGKHSEIDGEFQIRELNDFCRTISLQSNTWITLTDAAGHIVVDTNNRTDTPEKPVNSIRDTVEFQLLTGGDESNVVVTRDDPVTRTEIFFYLEKLPYMDSPVQYIRLGVPLEGMKTSFDELFTRILYLGIVIGLAATGMSFLVALQINRPIQFTIRAADRFASGDLDYWISYSSKIREFEALTRALKSMARQLSERLKNETRQKNELVAIFGSMVEAVLVIDNDESILRYNQAAAELFHADGTSLTGKSILEVNRNSQLHKFIQKTLSRNTAQEEDITIYNTHERYVRVTGIAIEESEGRTIGALIVIHDLTQIQKLERIRKDFVANVSHELKTPITAIKGFVETLKDGAVEDPETAQRFLDIILTHTNQLHAVIEDLLSLSRIEQETGSGKIHFAPGKLSDVIQAAISVCSKKADEHNVQFIVNGPVDTVIPMHRTLLQQAITNLADNAVKYGADNSTVEIAVEKLNDSVCIHVKDQGPGIAPEHLERLFERFYRVDKSRSRDLGGSGLGLAIVKHIVQSHRGKISVNSEIGTGTIFTIDLPLQS